MDIIKKQKRRVAVILFIVYLVILFYFLFFSEKMGRTYLERTYHYNLVPFKEIKRFARYWRAIGIPGVFLNLAGNVVAFLPAGIFFPVLWKRCRVFWRTALYGFELSLCVEITQLATKVGSFDVDDLILNTVGAMVGFAFYRLIAAKGGSDTGTT